ncbi:MAG: leucine-rich repeat domain-containing protein, partial [Clostridia bacterium]|nr:leucine-rich repeat domain-containing protein [Clostridia bacterium]
TVYAKWENVMYSVDENADGKTVLTGYNYERYGKDIVIPASIDGRKIDEIGSGVLVQAEKVELCGFENINVDAFTGCSELIELILPSTLEEMKPGMLGDCVKLKKLTVPYASHKRISGGYGTYNPLCMLFGESGKGGSCYEVEVIAAESNPVQDGLIESLTGEMRYVPKSLEEITVLGGDIAPYALAGLTSVKIIRILGDCKNVLKRALSGCTSLERVILPEGTEEVHRLAFNGCTKLNEVYVHESATEEVLDKLKAAGIDQSMIRKYMDVYEVDFLAVQD